MSRLHSSPALTLAFAAALLSASSCSLKNNMDEMHDDTHAMAKEIMPEMLKKTDDMSDTTKDLKKLTEDMKKTTDGLSTTTCKMYTSLRQGNSKVSRDTDLAAIRDLKDMTAKMATAAKYMQGFEYEVWTTSCADVIPLEIVIEQGATEFLTTIQSFVTDRANVTATSLKSLSSDFETLCAITGSLHRINPLQELYMKESNENSMRPLDILTEGLRLNQAKNRGQLVDAHYPSWAESVGKYEKDAEFALRLRANFLMAYGYSVAHSNKVGNAPGFLKKLTTLKLSEWFSKKWTPNLTSRDATEIRKRITFPLQLAKETRDSLASLGIDPMTDETIMGVWKNADFSKIDLGKMEKDLKDKDGLSRASAIRELIVARDQLLAK